MDHFTRIIPHLRVLPCLHGLKGEEIAVFGRMAQVKSILKNTHLFHETETAEFFFILRSGAVKLTKTSPEGRELIVKIMNPGDYFCCAPLCTSGKYMVGAMAVEDTDLIAIPAEHFKETLRREVGETGWRMITALCHKIRYLSDFVEELTFKDVEERVAATLLRLAQERPSSERIVSFQLTHQEIASMTGTVREVVSRTISKLKKRGAVVDSGARGFTVDRDRLLRLLGRGSLPSS